MTTSAAVIDPPRESGLRAPAKLLASVSELLERYLDEPKTEDEVATALGIQRHQGRRWLKQLVADGAVERLSKPTRYRAVGTPDSGTLICSGGGIEPAEQLFASVRDLLLLYLEEPRTVDDVARALDVQKNQA